MSLTPAYGETPVSAEDEAALTAWARELLGEPLTKAAVFDLEQGIQVQETREYLVPAVLDGTLTLDELLSDRFLRELHERLYGEIWDWAGVFRTRELNIGVAPWNISSDLVQSFDSIRYRWSLGHWSPRQLGMAAHAESVRIHPFADGNGRTTRLLGDLVFLAAQTGDLEEYDWQFDGFDKRRYVELLRQFDVHREPDDLATYLRVRPFGE